MPEILDPFPRVPREALAAVVARFGDGDTSSDPDLTALKEALDWRCEHEWMHLGNIESDGEDCRHSECFCCGLDVPGWVPNGDAEQPVSASDGE